MKKKIVSIVGARPNFIKLAALHPLIAKTFDHIIIHTGQHYDHELSKNFFEEFSIPTPKYNLNVGSSTRQKQVTAIKRKASEVLKLENPDLVIVYGDVNSTLGAALAAKELGIKIGHVEAGIRSYEKSLPEEINRVETDAISTLLFCPSELAVKNLKREKVKRGVYFTGDVMLDILVKTKPDSSILKKYNLKKGHYYLSTLHRQSNADSKKTLISILSALDSLDETVIMPIHPRTKKTITKYKIKSHNIKFIKPVKFSQNIALEKNAKTIITDSGGVQKEAYWLKVPCVTLRDSTEWSETVSSGWNKLAGANKNLILESVKNFKTPVIHHKFYQAGNASRGILEILKNYLSQ